MLLTDRVGVGGGGMRRVMVLALVPLAFAACGGDDGSRSGDSQTTEGQQYVAAMMATYDEEDGFTEAEALCAAEGTVDVIGVEDLEQAGVSPEELATYEGEGLAPGFTPSPDQADQLVDVFFECVDFGKVIFNAAASEEGIENFPEAKIACVGEKLENDEVFHEAMERELFGASTDEADEADVNTAVARAFDACDINFGDLMSND
jgi:hypothetical protein